MTTILDGSFETSGYHGTYWSNSGSGFAVSAGNNYTWKTDGTLSVYNGFGASGSRDNDDICVERQTGVLVDTKFVLTFDLNIEIASTGYEYRVKVGNTVVYTKSLSSTGIFIDEEVVVDVSEGTYIIELGVYSTGSSPNAVRVSTDNIRVFDTEYISGRRLCYDTGNVYDGIDYTGLGHIDLVDIDGAHDTVRTHITTPWNDTHTDQFFDVNDVKTWYVSVPADESRMYYSVKCTQIFYGTETWWAEFTECYWHDYGNRYVTTSGNNNNDGMSWATPWRNVGYGFQNVPTWRSECTLYVEEGTYTGETGSDFDPVADKMNMNILPTSHAEGACTVTVELT